jgi:hypothetical protein
MPTPARADARLRTEASEVSRQSARGASEARRLGRFEAVAVWSWLPLAVAPVAVAVAEFLPTTTAWSVVAVAGL